jgi:hypothetical protein
VTRPDWEARLSQLLAGDGQLHGGAEIEARDPDGSVALLAPLARHYRVDDDVLWIRPIVGGYAPAGAPGLPPYAFHLNEARPRALAVEALVESGEELVFRTAGGQLVRIRPAGPQTSAELERWDTFCAVVLSAEDELALDRVWGDSWVGEWE